MRKYRGQRIDKKEWVYGYLFKIWDKTHILWGTTNNIPNMIEVIPSTVGQQVGHCDKHGVELYVFDIIQHGKYICKIMFSEYVGKFYIQVKLKDRNKICPVFEHLEKSWEKIGTVFDNPELMEEIHCMSKTEAVDMLHRTMDMPSPKFLMEGMVSIDKVLECFDNANENTKKALLTSHREIIDYCVNYIRKSLENIVNG